MFDRRNHETFRENIYPGRASPSLIGLVRVREGVMTTANWDDLYGRPVFSKDFGLLVLAALLHAPLLLLEMKAPVKPSSSTDNYINIKLIADKTYAVKPVDSSPIKPLIVDLGRQLREINPPTPDVRPLPPAPTREPVLTAKNLAQVLANTQIPIPPTRKDFVDHVTPGLVSGVKFREGPITTGAIPIGKPVGAPETIASARTGKTGFTTKTGTLESLGQSNNSITTGAPPSTIAIPISKTLGKDPQEERTFKNPTPINLTPLSPVPPKVTTITTGKSRPISMEIVENVEITQETIRPVSIRPSNETAEQLSRFPITGPLAHRPVELQKPPVYPEWARLSGVQGVVRVQFRVGPDGRVKDDVRVLRGSGYPDLDKEAMAAVRRWLFAPLKNNQQNLEEVGTVEFKFSMN